MEQTSVYSFHPAHILNKNEDLRRIGAEVVVQNPRAIHRFKGLFEEDKMDKIDAFRIADFLRFGAKINPLSKKKSMLPFND